MDLFGVNHDQHNILKISSQQIEIVLQHSMFSSVCLEEKDIQPYNSILRVIFLMKHVSWLKATYSSRCTSSNFCFQERTFSLSSIRYGSVSGTPWPCYCCFIVLKINRKNAEERTVWSWIEQNCLSCKT